MLSTNVKGLFGSWFKQVVLILHSNFMRESIDVNFLNSNFFCENTVADLKTWVCTLEPKGA